MSSLPTYREATNPPEIALLVAEYLDNNSLLAATRVCRRWHRIMNALIWGSPINLICQRRRPFHNLHLFTMKIRATHESRTSTTLFLVTTLDFRVLVALAQHPVHHRQYHQEEVLLTTAWAIKHTTYLPNLRFIFLDGLRTSHPLPSLNHEYHQSSHSSQLVLFSAFALRINPFWITTQEALHNIMFLDMSYTHRPSNFTQLFSRVSFPNLRILKLRGLQLTDSMLPNIVLETGLKLWSLDLRDNLLTGKAIELLTRNCFGPPVKIPINGRTNVHSKEGDIFAAPPAYEREVVVDHQGQVERPPVGFRPDDEQTFRKYLENISDLDEKDDLLRATGLTHLYISANKLSIASLDLLLRYTNNLHLLNIGSIRVPSSTSSTYLGTASSPLPHFHIAGSVTQVLRVHHSAVTGIVTPLLSWSSRTYRLSQVREVERTSRREDVFLTPRDNNRLRQLTLTDIPTKSYGPILHRLLNFLVFCEAQQRELQKAALSAAHRRAPKPLPGLQVLRLEFVAEESGSNRGGVSASEDLDADAFLQESSGDFSFFKDENVTKAENLQKNVKGKQPVQEVVYDVVEELRAFRKNSFLRWKGKLEIVGI
ncbi:hypothetical protein BJ875DRAFT_377821 [Amylocarpus encephaloides]|uniref:F-box domain-containing protein n=1 Tax=Amylocarpus encephaloides TaxID=45428 RepID=A0A9P7YHQ6_9HELO|nr:hypothetical protein BJ875DRAFT_377821 [Amylocarpus encephaloides]